MYRVGAGVIYFRIKNAFQQSGTPGREPKCKKAERRLERAGVDSSARGSGAQQAIDMVRGREKLGHEGEDLGVVSTPIYVWSSLKVLRALRFFFRVHDFCFPSCLFFFG